MIFSLIYQSIIIVIILTFSFGPSFFSLINYSIKKGFKSASMLAIGVVGSDLFICLFNIFIVHYGFTEWINDAKNQRFAGILAGIILIIFGSFYFKRDSEIQTSDEIETSFSIKNETHPFWLVVKGFVLNLFNPAVWFLWLGNVTIISNFFNHAFVKVLIYFSILNAIIFSVEIFKIYLANKIKKIINQQVVHTISVVTGAALIIFGIYLIYNYYFEKI